ncbi:GyrI-like domain-containing protein [Cellvibrio mixtus]|uniref:GyrI-like domain-containing protein n=1 Tax=Cellvibrio mixtus TaxID=39650 RepID=UPI00069346BD|nr:GyrI-like domain-containing protein [Cellvibrio mixtus]
MNESNNTSVNKKIVLAQPRFEHAGPLLIAGLREPMDQHAAQKIPQLWQQLTGSWDQIPQRVGVTGFGLCIHVHNREYYYMVGCAVWDFTGLPETFSPFIIPSQTYAIFKHSGSVDSIRATIDFAFDKWLPSSGYKHATAEENALHFFERYGEQFNPHTGEGDIEIWLPVFHPQASHSP